MPSDPTLLAEPPGRSPERASIERFANLTRRARPGPVPEQSDYVDPIPEPDVHIPTVDPDMPNAQEVAGDESPS